MLISTVFLKIFHYRSYLKKKKKSATKNLLLLQKKLSKKIVVNAAQLYNIFSKNI